MARRLKWGQRTPREALGPSGNSADVTMAFDDLAALPRSSIPDSDGLVLRRAGNDLLAVRRKGNAVHAATVLETVEFLSAPSVPNAGGEIA